MPLWIKVLSICGNQGHFKLRGTSELFLITLLKNLMCKHVTFCTWTFCMTSLSTAFLLCGKIHFWPPLPKNKTESFGFYNSGEFCQRLNMHGQHMISGLGNIFGKGRFLFNPCSFFQTVLHQLLPSSSMFIELWMQCIS